MLGKLLKYEFRSTARVFLPFYAALLILSLLARLTVWNYHETSPGWMALVMGLSLGFYILAIVAVSLLTTVVSVIRYYRNLYGDEGYLMQTLPVSADQLIWSKLIVSTVWSIVSVGMILLALGVLVWNRELWTIFFQRVWELWMEEIAPLWTPSITLVVVEFVFSGLLSLIAGILSYYTAITLGQMMGKHRILGAVVSYIGITIVWEILSSAILFLPQLTGGWQADEESAMLVIHLFTWMIIAGVAIQGTAQYLVTRWVLIHKTDLA